MNIQHILTEIEKTDPDMYDRMSPRRKVMQQFVKTGRVMALTAIPLALGSLFKQAYGRDVSKVTAVLQFALTLEHLEAEFYKKAVTDAPIPAGAPKAAITTIRDHEVAHVTLLQTVLGQLGATPNPKPTFDFSAGNGSGNGPFKDVFTNYGLFLAVAQTFEDTGVRAYKGQAGDLISSNDALTAALQIHSVEARHASHIRSMRRAFTSNNTIKPWITGKDTGGIGPAVQASYNGEELTTQAGINIVNINNTNISASAASESFDEPLSKQAVLDIVDPFIV